MFLARTGWVDGVGSVGGAECLADGEVGGVVMGDGDEEVGDVVMGDGAEAGDVVMGDGAEVEDEMEDVGVRHKTVFHCRKNIVYIIEGVFFDYFPEVAERTQFSWSSGRSGYVTRIEKLTINPIPDVSLETSSQAASCQMRMSDVDVLVLLVRHTWSRFHRMCMWEVVLFGHCERDENLYLLDEYDHRGCDERRGRGWGSCLFEIRRERRKFVSKCA